jgi:hypothetical protein
MAKLDVDEVAKTVLAGVLDKTTLEAEELDLLTGMAGKFGAAFSKYDAGGVVWEVRKPVPGRDEFVVFAIFNGDPDNDDDNVDGDVRIYAIPAVDGAPFVRYKLNRLHPTLLGLTLDKERFERVLTEEWEALAVRFGVSEADGGDGTLCPTCNTVTETSVEEEDAEDPMPIFCGKCGERLPIDAEVSE